MLLNLVPLSLALAFIVASGTACFAADAHSLARQGGQMDAAEKDSLEEQVANDPNDIESRTKLLGFYFIKGRQDPDAKSARQRHVLWLIENAPESDVLGLPYSQINKVLESDGYEKAKQAWLKVTQESPATLAAIANASRFFLLHDREIAEELLLRGQEADGDAPSWPASLGQLYSLGLTGISDGPARKTAARKAFRQYELAYDRSEPMRKDALLTDLAKSAFEAGLLDDAKKYAEEMLDDDAPGWNQGNRLHHGNLILGRIALAKNDVGEAKSRLLLAGRTTGSPQLNSFGPNMLLAKELLERGETEVVLEYFAQCAKFWKSPRRKLEQWVEDVKADRIPQFGGNLAY
jgi:hypothetical protein